MFSPNYFTNIKFLFADSRCESLPDPSNGHSECINKDDGIQCLITCQDGYAIPISQLNDEGIPKLIKHLHSVSCFIIEVVCLYTVFVDNFNKIQKLLNYSEDNLLSYSFIFNLVFDKVWA